MTRRERHLRIVESFGRDASRRRLNAFSTETLLSMLSDEGVERLTRALLSDFATHKKFAALNRANARRSGDRNALSHSQV